MKKYTHVLYYYIMYYSCIAIDYENVEVHDSVSVNPVHLAIMTMCSMNLMWVLPWLASWDYFVHGISMHSQTVIHGF